MKAMGEAERSIAIKRKAVVPRPVDREDSPSEVYTPKRRKSSAREASPPPYIPSRKESSIGSRDSVAYREEHQDQLSRRTDARQILSSRDRKDLISRSRRMELFKRMGIERKEEPVRGKRHQPQTIDNGRLRGKVQAPVSSREVTSDKRSGGVRDLRIMARLGPIRATEVKKSDEGDGMSKSLDLRSKMTRSTYTKDHMLQIVINPTASPALKDAIGSRLGKIVKMPDSSPDSNGDEDKDDKVKISERKGSTTERTRMAVSSHAKSLVNKQCREAVMSVNNQDQVRRRQRSVSPDTRRVEADISDEDEESKGNERSEIVIEKKYLSLRSPSASDRIGVKETSDLHVTEKEWRRDSISEKDGDLADLIGETLEPELLHDSDNVQDELNLDLEKNDDDDFDDIETMIGVKTEDDKPKLGTRFIVTLDGVDERAFDAEAEKNKSMTSPFIQPAVPGVPKLSPSSQYLPHQKLLLPPANVLPIRSSLVHGYNIGDPLPPPNPIAILPREPVKPLPPKIQPFSINLKDSSDDEIEDKESRRQPLASGYLTQTSSEGLSALQKAKMLERCKFWPACAAGAECEFHHPNSYCKTFPNCKFGDKCLFIHPNCKFDSKCTRSDCPFTHISRRSGISPTIPIPVSIPKPAPPPASTTVCRFFPNCHNHSCPFVHPKPCRFGLTCQNASCLFYHPPAIPTSDKLKWKAHPLKEALAPKFSSTQDPVTKFRQPVAKVSPMSAGSSNTSPTFR